ncbi:MFS transporter [Desnuesiella massiliensis]|uniref:MFS transporter n=1 Tax=Desnuesiella massiliensis TaxID=1650662 RepID=UPI0006E3DDD1|nr:MFS transporter [Desnuesiella massiliensis]
MKKTLNQKNLLLTIVVLFWFAQYVYIPFQNLYLVMNGVSSNMIGTIIGAYGISQCLLRLPAGIFADSIGKHKCFIFLGVIFAGIASCIRVIMPAEIGFLIANVLSGIASSMWISYMVHYTGYFSKEDQQKATSKIILVNNVGMLFGFIVSTLFYNNLGMKFLCATSVIAAIVGSILSFWVKDHKQVDKKTSFRECISICKNKRLIFFSLLALIQQGIQMSTTMSFTTQILQELGAAPLVVGLASIFYMVSAVVSARFASSKFCVKKGPKVWIPIVFSLICLYCILVPNVDNIFIIFSLQLLPGMSTGILLSYLTSEAMVEVPQHQRSTAMGLFQAVYAIGMSIFPMVVGKIAGFMSIKSGYFILAFIALVGAVLSKIYYNGSISEAVKTRYYME